MSRPIVIQKYGGTSVGDAEKIKKVARRIVQTMKKEKEVVAVVSAPGDTTSRLMDMAYSISKNPDERELDVLLATGEQQGISLVAMAIKEMGYKAISFTGHQVGIVTDSFHSRARIKKIDTSKVIKALDEGNIVIVAGFQGISEEENITTLGRGGSDLSAVALAAVLDARACEIYTDVEGVFTADPSIVKNARKINEISYDEMLELASSGAKVMQSRSLEIAKKHNIVINIKSSMNNNSKESGTMIMKETKDLEQVVVRGVTLDEDQVKMSIMGVPDKPGMAAQIFGSLSKENINVDMIIQSSAYKSGENDISFTVDHSRLNRAREILEKVKNKIGAKEIIVDEDVDKVSIVGVGMRSHAGVASKMFEVLAKKGINIEMISTSEIKISCVVSRNKGKTALKELHHEFCE
ncbi:MAG: aspartate kinase [Elusimicrobiota bacterium]